MKNKDLHSTGFRIKSGMTEGKGVIARSQGRRGNPWGDCFTSFAMTGECGRSMVEMLGVLAIIGVLSVAGIAGYSMAMKRYRANEIISVASTFYVLADAKREANWNFQGNNLSEVDISKPFGTVDMSLDSTKNPQEIAVTGVGDDTICGFVKEAFSDGHLGFKIITCS